MDNRTKNIEGSCEQRSNTAAASVSEMLSKLQTSEPHDTPLQIRVRNATEIRVPLLQASSSPEDSRLDSHKDLPSQSGAILCRHCDERQANPTGLPKRVIGLFDRLLFVPAFFVWSRLYRMSESRGNTRETLKVPTFWQAFIVHGGPPFFLSNFITLFSINELYFQFKKV